MMHELGRFIIAIWPFLILVVLVIALIVYAAYKDAREGR